MKDPGSPPILKVSLPGCVGADILATVPAIICFGQSKHLNGWMAPSPAGSLPPNTYTLHLRHRASLRYIEARSGHSSAFCLRAAD
jgi:hypothetical protein